MAQEQEEQEGGLEGLTVHTWLESLSSSPSVRGVVAGRQVEQGEVESRPQAY